MLGTHPVVGIPRNVGYTCCGGIPRNVGYTLYMLWHVYLEMLGTYSVRGIPGYTCKVSTRNVQVEKKE